MTTPEFNIPVNLLINKENIGILRSLLQQTASDAQSIGTVLDQATKLPGVSNIFRRNTVETQKATRAMQRDYQVMRIETARIETPLRQTARAARSLENIAKSTNVAIRTSARLHNDVNGLLKGQQTIQETLNKLGKTRVDSEEQVAKSVDRQAVILEKIRDTITKITGNITEGTFDAGQGAGFLASHLAFASGFLLVISKNWSKIAALILTTILAVKTFNLALSVTRRIFSTIQTASQQAGDIVRTSFSEGINPETVQRRQIQADVLGVPIDQLDKALATYSAASIKAATDTANLIKIFSPTELAVLQQFREEYQALTASKRSLSAVIAVSLLPAVEFLNRAIFPLIRALTDWFGANKVLAQFLITTGIAALFILSAGLLLLAIKLAIATGAAGLFGAVLYTALAPLLPFIIAGVALAAVIALIIIHWRTIINWFRIGIAVVRDLWARISQGPARFLLLLTPIGQVIAVVIFLVSSFEKIKSAGVAAFNFLLPPLRAVFDIMQKIFGLAAKIGGFFSKILNIGGSDTNLSRELDRQNTVREVEVQELNSRAQALASLPDQPNQPVSTIDQAAIALANQRASFSSGSIDSELFKKLTSLGEAGNTGKIEISIDTNVGKAATDLSTIVTSLDKIDRIEKRNLNSRSNALAKIRRAETQNLDLRIQTLAKISTAEARNLSSRTQALSEIRKIEMQNLNAPPTVLADSSINQQDKIRLLASQQSIPSISTTNNTKDTQQTDIKIDNRYDIEGVTDPRRNCRFYSSAASH